MIAKVYGAGTGDFNRLQLKTAGTVTITANQPGNGTYAVAPCNDFRYDHQAQPVHCILTDPGQVDRGLRFRSRSGCQLDLADHLYEFRSACGFGRRYHAR